jgi:hypothetical protein
MNSRRKGVYQREVGKKWTYRFANPDEITHYMSVLSLNLMNVSRSAVDIRVEKAAVL